MKFSYNWLKELSGTEKSPEELAALLLARSFEVEEVKKFEQGLGSVVIGEVLETMPHPDANRLKVTQVRVAPTPQSRGLDSSPRAGEQEKSIFQIVCGAPNVAAGQKVAVALPGAKLPNGAEIQEAEIRGVKSSGMICALDELGFGTDHEGIWVLPDDSTVGMPLAEAMGLDDSIIDVKILPNRGTDALSHYGLARELSALEGRPFPSEGMFVKECPERMGDGGMAVTVENEEICAAYTGLSFRLAEERTGLPLPMLGRMVALGVYIIHPAADIANFLSLLYGQPMHAFDAAKLFGKKIVVRFAKEGEKLLLLDGREITLTKEDLVIADANGLVALAGIMGGKESAVSAGTEDVFFEIANFDPKTIRKSRVRHGMATNASYLFEHGVDRSWPEKLSGEVVSRFSEWLGAEYRGDVSIRGAEAAGDRKVVLSFARIEGILGVAVPGEDTLSILRLLSIGVDIRGEELHLTIPSFRPDLVNEADIVEEIGRVYGYEHILPVAPMLPLVSREQNRERALERSLMEYLAHAGWDEIMTYSFYGKDLLAWSGVPEEAHLALENPMNPSQAYLRAKLLPTVFEKALENMARTDRFKIFESGRIHFIEEESVREEKRIAFALSLRESVSGGAFFSLKGETKRLFDVLGMSGRISFEPTGEVPPLFHPGRTARVMVDGEPIGVIGEAHPSFTKKFGLRRIAIAELSFPILFRLSGTPIVMSPIPKFPYVSRDISLVVPSEVSFTDLEKTIVTAGGDLLRECTFFDLYEKGKEKNIAFHLSFGADDRTIGSNEADEAFQSIVSAAEKGFGAKLSL
ncbi:MAG: phenylalanine--tRNA ligase subunit beta [Candidatus Moranbacteria bacterium]|nr:phenylalanine--tRNA ligase subunit beta [Candidatus Moranbacteria bacterium]